MRRGLISGFLRAPGVWWPLNFDPFKCPSTPRSMYWTQVFDRLWLTFSHWCVVKYFLVEYDWSYVLSRSPWDFSSLPWATDAQKVAFVHFPALCFHLQPGWPPVEGRVCWVGSWEQRWVSAHGVFSGWERRKWWTRREDCLLCFDFSETLVLWHWFFLPCRFLPPVNRLRDLIRFPPCQCQATHIETAFWLKNLLSGWRFNEFEEPSSWWRVNEFEAYI